MRRRTRAALAALLLLPLLGLPGPRYLLRVGVGQARLMAGRVPLAEALRRDDLTAVERAALERVPAIKAFGQREIGLSPNANYDTVNLDFDQVVWNVSGCAADRFVSHRYRYPVVGALPYIGYFDRASADAEAERLRALGWVTMVRAAGAYSTLGWFEDPLWRSMLRWDEPRLAETILHELAHATVWLPGHGDFNESLATFVGEQAAARWLRARDLEVPGTWQRHLDAEADAATWRRFHHELVDRLDGLYGAGLPRDDVLRLRPALIEDAARRYAALPFREARWADAFRPERAGNAELAQVRVYHSDDGRFDAALTRFGGDLPAFVAATRTLERARRAGGRDFDPWAALDVLTP